MYLCPKVKQLQYTLMNEDIEAFSYTYNASTVCLNVYNCVNCL